VVTRISSGLLLNFNVEILHRGGQILGHQACVELGPGHRAEQRRWWVRQPVRRALPDVDLHLLELASNHPLAVEPKRLP
jgi:hypothetical protein